jgi:hypothetical protein
MSSELQAVLEIAAIGSTLLFAALAGLIGLMYLLTAPQPRRGTILTQPLGSEDEAERARRARAIAIAVAAAQAEVDRPAGSGGSTEWRHLHRARRMDQPSRRAAPRPRQ